MIFKKIHQVLSSGVKLNLIFLYLLMLIAASIELLSLGSIPIFINHLISDNFNNSIFNIDIVGFLNFIPVDNTNLKFAIF